MTTDDIKDNGSSSTSKSKSKSNSKTKKHLSADNIKKRRKTRSHK